MTEIKDKALLDIARQLIELKWNVRLTSIEFEDGSGLKYIVTTTANPAKKEFINLQRYASR